MGNFRLFQTVVRLVVAATTLAAATSAEAQVSPKFFLDTFDDMNVQDGTPVNWSASQRHRQHRCRQWRPCRDGGTRAKHGSWIAVDDYTYDDISIRTRLAVSPDKPWTRCMCHRSR